MGRYGLIAISFYIYHPHIPLKQLIKKVDNSITIAFDTGAFDDWCVYVTSPKRGKFAPTDSEYFTRLNLIGEEFGHQTIYNDFIKIYDLTTSTVDSVVLDSITDISRGYGTRSLEMEVWFTVIYAGMIAE